jgi:hypothetical protein
LRGPPEKEPAARHQQDHQRHEDRANRIQVAHWIEGYAPLCEGRQVAAMARHVTVRGLVQRDGEQHGQRIDGNGLYELIDFHRRGGWLGTC